MKGTLNRRPTRNHHSGNNQSGILTTTCQLQPSYLNMSHGGPVKMESQETTSLSKSLPSLGDRLAPLFAENILAKSYRTASKITGSKNTSASSSPGEHQKSPQGYPEYVPQDGPDASQYILRDPQFWTCGFFPGTLYSLLERFTRYPQSIHLSDHSLHGTVRRDLAVLGSLCAEPLHAMAERTDTHDVGFMIMPAFQKSWELMGNTRSLETIRRAAHSLASRFVPSASAIRSWDQRVQKNLSITSQETDLITIIDSMCNLHLMYYAASHFPEDASLRDIATSHAKTLLRTHLRAESVTSSDEGHSSSYTGQLYSTYHVANLDPRTGAIKQQFTAQGYADQSTWARGQAWAILGYAQTYKWTNDPFFLEAACGLSEYFLHRLATAPACVEGTAGGARATGRNVPLWDFDAPIENETNPLRDSSAGAIAANGFLLLSQSLTGLGKHDLASRFRDAAIDIAEDLVHFAVAKEEARFLTTSDGAIDVEDTVPGQKFEGLVKNGTANNNENAIKRYANHGLVYGDYYVVELGNQLLAMGLV